MTKAKYIYELHIYWDDGVTVECRYFPTKKKAKEYAKSNGIPNYVITKEEEVSNIHFY
jgi:hypothetical protein